MQDMGIEKKKKGRPTIKCWRVLRWILGILVFFAVGIIILAIWGPVIGGIGQITQPKLDSEYLPTAEYLFNNPPPTPQGFPAYLMIEQDTHGFWIDSENVEKFCVQGYVPKDTHVSVKFNQAIVDGNFGMFSTGLTNGTGRVLSHCIEGVVATGLHLLSVEMSSATWTETYSYTWAVEITNDGYNYIPEYLLRNLDNQ